MFKEPFSFEGRIRRTEFGVSFLIFAVARTIITMLAVGMTADSDPSAATMLSIVFSIPLLFFLWAQGAKRCHDIGWSGWVQLIPFAMLVIIFMDGEAGDNNYGTNPKSELTQNDF
jgi:uncharacterized membrane protein YhaH (DUF805 family)